MKKKKNFLSIIIAIVVIIYTIFGTDLLNDLENSTASVSNAINESEKIEVDGELKVYFLDVGQADSILIRTDNHNMLIDAGNNEDGEKLVNYIKSLGIDEFDYVVGTHPHEDHIGGMDNIINNFKIDTFYMPNVVTTTKTFEDVLDALASKNLFLQTPDINEEFNFGNAKIKVMYEGDETNDLNDSSIVLRLTYGNNSFLFTGDATSNVEKEILNKDIKSDVLKVGHHGSSYSSTDAFLDKIKPKYAVIEVGKNNSYGHPTKETLNKLTDRKIKVYRTDLERTIIFTSDGNNISVETLTTDTNG